MSRAVPASPERKAETQAACDELVEELRGNGPAVHERASEFVACRKTATGKQAHAVLAAIEEEGRTYELPGLVQVCKDIVRIRIECQSAKSLAVKAANRKARTVCIRHDAGSE
jgi:hypothetical protein